MSQSSLLMTSCTVIDPTSPPQTTDEDSSDTNKPEPSGLVTFPPSCQLTPPTPPSTIEAQIPSSVKEFSLQIEETRTQVVGRKRRQKSTPLPLRHMRAEETCNDDSFDFNEDSTCDYSPARKTRRKSIRIRELTRHPGAHSSDKLDARETGAADDLKFSNICSGSEGTFVGLNDSHNNNDNKMNDVSESTNNFRSLKKDGCGTETNVSPLSLLSCIVSNAVRHDDKIEHNSINTTKRDNFPRNAITSSSKSDASSSAIRHPFVQATGEGYHLKVSSPLGDEVKVESLVASSLRSLSHSKPTINQLGSHGNHDHHHHQHHRVDMARQFQPRHQPYSSPAVKQNVTYPAIHHQGRKPFMLPPTHHLHQLHQLQMPQDDETHICIECNKVFKRSIYLQRHMAREHWTTAKLFKCDTCSYETKHQSNLLVHKRTHTGERPYYCGECGQRYTQGHLLKAHIRSRHSSNMQLYNMEKRSPNEILIAQPSSLSSTLAGEGGESRRRSPNDFNKKHQNNHPNLRINDGFDIGRSNEGLEKIQFLMEAAFQNQKPFQHHQHQHQRGHLDKETSRNQTKVFPHRDQSMCDLKSTQDVKDEIGNNGNFKHHHHQHHQSCKDPQMIQRKGGDTVHQVRPSNRAPKHGNGEIIDLDTPEPPTEMEVTDKTNQVQNGSLSPSSSFKSEQRKPEGPMTSHSFHYSNILNFPQQSVDYFQQPPLNSSIMFNAFLTPCLPSSCPVEVNKPTLNHGTPEEQLPLNISSSSCSEGEDQIVDVDGDDDDDVKPLNLSTQKINSDSRLPRRIASEFPRDLSKKSPIPCHADSSNVSKQFSTFKTFYGLHGDDVIQSVIKSVNQKLIPDWTSNGIATNSSPSEINSLKSRLSPEAVDDNPKFSCNKPTLDVTSKNLKVEQLAGRTSQSPCHGDHCPDRLKLENLRKDVYKMLRVFMPYFVLDDVEGKTDSLDNFLHEVLYSKLEG